MTQQTPNFEMELTSQSGASDRWHKPDMNKEQGINLSPLPMKLIKSHTLRFSGPRNISDEPVDKQETRRGTTPSNLIRTMTSDYSVQSSSNETRDGQKISKKKILNNTIYTLGVVGLILYCDFIQSFISLIFIICILMLIRYALAAQPYGVGYEENEEEKVVSIDHFIKHHDSFSRRFYQRQDGLLQLKEYKICQQKPLYWLQYSNYKQSIWLFVMIISTVFLIVKISLICILKYTSQINSNEYIFLLNSFEIYFSGSTGQIQYSAANLCFALIPNSLVIIYSLLSTITCRESSQKPMHELSKEGVSLVNKNYLIIIWIFLLASTCTSFSLIGFGFILFQAIIFIKILFVNNESIRVNQILTITFTMFLVVILVTERFFTTPLGLQILKDYPPVRLLIGSEATDDYSIANAKAISYLFCNLLLFGILQYTINENRMIIFKERFGWAIEQSSKVQKLQEVSINLTRNYLFEKKKELQLSKISNSKERVSREMDETIVLGKQLEILENNESGEDFEIIKIITQKITLFLTFIGSKIDDPIFTVHILQLFIIITILCERTYYSLGLVLWLIISGHTLNTRITYIFSVCLAFPCLIMNFLTLYYSSIPDIFESSMNLCYYNLKTCEKFGLKIYEYKIIRVLFLNITLLGFVIFTKQNQRGYHKIENQNPNFQDTYVGICMMILLRLSLSISLTLMFFVSFGKVCLINLIILLILLLFLININKSILSNIQTYDGAIQQMIPFYERYWMVLIIFYSIAILTDFCYELFLRGEISQVYAHLIGFSSNNYLQANYYVLFYFGTLQHNYQRRNRYQNKVVVKKCQSSQRIRDIALKVGFIRQIYKQYKQNFFSLEFIIIKLTIWICLAINITLLIGESYSVMNSIILIIFLILLSYYSEKQRDDKLDYKKFQNMWYFYLLILMLTVLIRYWFMLSSCIDERVLPSGTANLLRSENINIGLYNYQGGGEWKLFFKDIVNLIIGGYCQGLLEQFSYAQCYNRAIEQNQDIEPMFVGWSKEQKKRILKTALVSKTEQLKHWLTILKYIRPLLKRPLVMIAQFNTDIITIVVVISAVFKIRSFSIFIFMILYLSYFWRVHNTVLNQIKSKQLIKKLTKRLKQLKTFHLKMNLESTWTNSQIEEFEISVRNITYLRLHTRVILKKSVGRLSFYFCLFCLYLTYLSQYLSSSYIASRKLVNYARATLYFFGTYAVSEGDQSFQCGETEQVDSNIFSVTWFYIMLMFVNLIDQQCTKILVDELEDFIANDQNLSSREASIIMEIKNISGQASLKLFALNNPFLVIEDIEDIDPEPKQDQDVEEGSFYHKWLWNGSQRLSLQINYNKSKDILSKIALFEGFIQIFLRVIILIFLSNCLIVKNIFSFFYCIIGIYLLLRQRGRRTIKLINFFSIFSICFSYFFLLLNLQTPKYSTSANFYIQNDSYSVVYNLGLDDIQWQSYFGFSNGPIEDCQLTNDSSKYFYGKACETNDDYKWVFIMNTIVVSSIYIFLILIEQFTRYILAQAALIAENHTNSVKALSIIMRNNKKIIVDYKKWQPKSLNISSRIITILCRYCNHFYIIIVIILASTSYNIFNLIEAYIFFILYSVVNLFISQPIKPKQQVRLTSIIKDFIAVPSLSILLFLVLNSPSIRNYCLAQDSNEISSWNKFLCSQIFQMDMNGMIFIIFLTSLYLDFNVSTDLQQMRRQRHKYDSLKALLVSRALAYQQNYQLYKSIIDVQNQKQVFKQLQQIITQKLYIWHQKINHNDPSQSQNDLVSQKTELSQERASVFIQLPQEEQTIISIYQKSALHCLLLDIINWFGKRSQGLKFMGITDITDYIIASNQTLQRHMYLTLDEFIMEDYKIYSKELEFLEIFYSCIYEKIEDQRVLISTYIKEIEESFTAEVISQYNIIYGNSSAKDQIVEDLIEQQIKRFSTYQEHRTSKDLTFIHIYDPFQTVYLINTKSRYLPNLLEQKSTFRLLQFFFRELLRFVISHWSTVTALAIIFYFLKNDGLIGCVLPFFLYTIVMVFDGILYKIFWITGFLYFILISMLVFLVEQAGLNEMEYKGQGQTSEAKWYYPLYNVTGNGIGFEIILIYLIAVQLKLSRAWGIFQKLPSEIENIFQGYVRMKLNYFNQPVNLNTFQLYDQDRNLAENYLKIQSQNLEEDQPRSKVMNMLEERIIMDPSLLKKDQSVLQRTFSCRFSKPGKDFYPIIATIQLTTLIYTLFAYSTMTSSGQDLNNILKFNKIPGDLVIILIVQMIVMIIERYIALLTVVKKKQLPALTRQGTMEKPNEKKSFWQKCFRSKESQRMPQIQQKQKIYQNQAVMKYILQVSLVFIVYWFVFIYIGQPWIQQAFVSGGAVAFTSQQNYYLNNSSIVFYFLCSVYFYVSALQLSYGYREVKLRNTILQSFTPVSGFVIKIFNAIPFLLELKVLMDWTFTKTSLNVFQWFKVENIHYLMHTAKIQSRGFRKRKVGEPILPVVKLSLGCSLVVFILACIFGPLFLFSSLNPSNTLNLVNAGEITISLTNLDSGLSVQLYQSDQFFGLEKKLQGSEINEAFNQTVTNAVILTSPENGALQHCQTISYSQNYWDISEPLYLNLLQEIGETLFNNRTGRFILNASFSLSRDQDTSVPKSQRFQYPGNKLLKNFINNTEFDGETLKLIYDSLLRCPAIDIPLPYFYVDTVSLTSGSETFRPRAVLGEGIQTVSNMTMSLHCAKGIDSPMYGESWWNFTYAGVGKNINPAGSNGFMLFVITDMFSTLTFRYSIMSIYTSVILLIGGFIRQMFSGEVWMITLTDMVDPDDILQICQAISIARSQENFEKENILYFELIDILRSPEIVKVMTGSWTEVMSKKLTEQKATHILK